jgi:hypothetical protein
MAEALLVDDNNLAVPLEFTITQEGVGGVTGLTGGNAPTVAIRDGTTTDSYLDFADDTFKTSGWTTKFATLTEVERGHYNRVLDVNALGLNAGDALIAEFEVDDGGAVVGADHDIILITETLGDLAIVRKSITNRMEEAPGNPGTLILYDDDGTTVLLTWQLRDVTGGAIVGTVGSPARRSAGV